MVMSGFVVLLGRYRMFLHVVESRHGTEQERGQQPILLGAADKWWQSAPARRHQRHLSVAGN